MDMDMYQVQAARTINYNTTRNSWKHHALHGMAAEIGELHGLYQKQYQGHKMDLTHAKKELGDLLWFIAEYCTSQDWKLSDIAEMNLEKLMKRYPEGFDTEHSIHRKEGDV